MSETQKPKGPVERKVRRFEVWLDSGANAFSCNKQQITLDDIGTTSDEWDSMDDDQRESIMKDVAFNQSEWGFVEVDGYDA